MRLARLIPALFLAFAPLLQGCQTALPHGERQAAHLAPEHIPFIHAEAKRDGEGNYLVSWVGAGTGAVTVYAGADRNVSDRSRPVGFGAERGRVLVTNLAAGPRRFFAIVPSQGSPLVVADRDLHLASAPNFRDLGGYRTTDGRWVRMGLLYRSDQLDRLTSEDLARVAALGIGHIADLRTSGERRREPDTIPPGAVHEVMNVMADDEGSADLAQVMKLIRAGQAYDYGLGIYGKFVSADSARNAYSLLLQRVSEADGRQATLFHCTAGKDRTGWAAAVILTLLGVPRETVVADYLASNAALAEKNKKMLVSNPALASLDRALLEPLLGVQPAFLDAAFAEVEQRYGSFDAYRRKALGIDNALTLRLQQTYLAGGN